MGDFHTQPGTESACIFCGTTPNNGDKSCSTRAEAVAQTMAHPYGCPWFTKQDRQDWDRRNDPELPRNKIATLQARVEELTKALQFYADARRYQGANQHPIPNDPYGKPDAAYIMDVTRDGGAIAYRALRVPLEDRS